MKLARLAVGLIFGMLGTAQAAENAFTVISNREAIASPGPLLQAAAADPANERIELVAVNDQLFDRRSESINFNLPGGVNVQARQTEFEAAESGNDIWIGKVQFSEKSESNDDLIRLDNLVIAVRSGKTVLATIRVKGQLYRLVPVENGAHALIEVNGTKFLADESVNGYAEMLRNAEAVKFDDEEPIALRAISTIRIMVAFGPAATSAIGNEQQAIDLSFAESNQALAATNTDVRFQQAGSIQFFTQSESTNYSTMLTRLTSLTDGFYDSIGTQRNNNAADIVAYVGPSSPGLCGQAAGIATSNSRAYFIMNPSCLSGNYTFVHEAGHVVGTRHDNDPTTSPFAYGHGYVITSQNRRTVMAVNNGPCSSCTRIGAFSTPSYTLGGVPIGTASFNDNTRVWRTRGPTVAAFR
jgi:peptidyl-Asp metalloendopeptidase